MGQNLQQDDEEITDINVTPFVDVMLVLLIIFMATTTYMVHSSIQVSLPDAQTGKALSKTEKLSFVIDKNSKIYADGNLVELSDLKFYIETKKNLDGGLKALISADKDTPHGSVIKLIDEVKKNGIKDFALHVESTVANP